MDSLKKTMLKSALIVSITWLGDVKKSFHFGFIKRFQNFKIWKQQLMLKIGKEKIQQFCELVW